MPTLHFRVSGHIDAADEIVSRLRGLDGIERAAKTSDPDPHDDPAATEAASSIDAGAHRIEIDTLNPSNHDSIRNLILLFAVDLGVAVKGLGNP